MQVVANTKYVRTSPKKLREIAKAVVGLAPQIAIDRLTLLGSKGGRLIAQTIKSAHANAKQTAAVDAAVVRITRIEIGKGPFFKRFQPVSRGMAHEIKKRTAHIKVILEEGKGGSGKR